MMRFIVDECTGTKVANFLRNQGYEVFSVYEQARGSTDTELIHKACTENWILITNDKDFGEKVYRENHPHHGIILLRLDDERATAKIAALEHLLASYAAVLPEKFTVVTPKNVRFAGRVS
ncbi:DUF5615 family PIN-like protein [Thiothrix unzii]|jgi:predicted nuclease of predicted toxin-antitoxin system|uniref:DUF5615 family PIN-like protein n=1 Tax=Thiothrix unzii TaxID=111769 RepID=UPI002A361977|nr:DUF5615 family PIN-like protein [Thiothrix unzii]MDX9988490.1 DUF5615 family PIN-like protein [Thiothrix unzii]